MAPKSTQCCWMRATTAAVNRIPISGLMNCRRRTRHQGVAPAKLYSLGPASVSRREASAALRPSGPDDSLAKTASGSSACRGRASLQQWMTRCAGMS